MIVPTIIEDFYPDRIRTFKESPTLRGDRQGLKVAKDMKIRRLTPTECERLQAFPDGWTELGFYQESEYISKSGKKKFVGQVLPISDTQRYKCLGNAVTTSVITAIIENLIK